MQVLWKHVTGIDNVQEAEWKQIAVKEDGPTVEVVIASEKPIWCVRIRLWASVTNR